MATRPTTPLPPPGPIEGLPRPAWFKVGPGMRHGLRATYANGCRCEWCRYAWAEARRPKVQARRRAIKIEEARALLAEEEARLSRG